MNKTLFFFILLIIVSCGQNLKHVKSNGPVKKQETITPAVIKPENAESQNNITKTRNSIINQNKEKCKILVVNNHIDRFSGKELALSVEKSNHSELSTNNAGEEFTLYYYRQITSVYSGTKVYERITNITKTLYEITNGDLELMYVFKNVRIENYINKADSGLSVFKYECLRYFPDISETEMNKQFNKYRGFIKNKFGNLIYMIDVIAPDYYSIYIYYPPRDKLLLINAYID